MPAQPLFEAWPAWQLEVQGRKGLFAVQGTLTLLPSFI